MALACNVIVAAVGSVPEGASAGTISTRETGSMFAPTTEAVYVAELGETNAVSVRIGGGAVTLRDETAPVSASDGCQAVNAHEARCAASQTTLSLGDHDDSATVEGGGVHADGGDGDDRLVGGDDWSTLDGGSGDDQLYGGPGTTLLYGGGGSDLLSGGAGRDLLYGDGARYDPPEEPQPVASDRLVGAPAPTAPYTTAGNEPCGSTLRVVRPASTANTTSWRALRTLSAAAVTIA